MFVQRDTLISNYCIRNMSWEVTENLWNCLKSPVCWDVEYFCKFYLWLHFVLFFELKNNQSFLNFCHLNLSMSLESFDFLVASVWGSSWGLMSPSTDVWLLYCVFFPLVKSKKSTLPLIRLSDNLCTIQYPKAPNKIKVGSQMLARITQDIFSDLIFSKVLTFEDDLVIISETAEDHIKDVRKFSIDYIKPN